MRSHAKAANARSNQRQVGGLGRVLRGAFRPARTRLVLVTALFAVLAALTASPALALPPITFAEGVAQSGTGTGAAGEIIRPEGMAVDQSSGDLYVADRNNFRIDKFDSDGNFLMAWGFGVADGVTPELQSCGPEATPPMSRCFRANFSSDDSAGNMFPEAVAVDQASGDVYVAGGFNRVTKFSSTGQFLSMFGKNVNTTPGTLTPNLCTAANLAEPGAICGQGATGSGAGEFFTAPTAVTVDAAGNVWVGDTNRLVHFDSGGNYISQAPIAGGGETQGLARNSAGDFYVKSASLAGVRKYTPSGSPIDTLTLSQILDGAGTPLALALDGADNVYVADRPVGGQAVFMEFNSAGEQIGQFGAGQVIGTKGPGAIAIGDTVGALYAASDSFKPPTGEIYYAQRFPLPGPGPLPANERVTGILPTEATLEATLNPEGDETTYHFEYGTSASYGQSTPTKTLSGTGFDDEAVQAELEHLIPDTTYHFRLVATNHCKPAEPSVECTVASSDVTFATLPAVGIDAQWATDVAANSAILHAELDPLGVAAQWWIEYGTGPGYGQSTPEIALPAGLGNASVSSLITDLAPGTTYHYRFAARDERDGTVYAVHGSDRTFITQLSGLGFELADDRAWELVSPPNKSGGSLLPLNQGVIRAAADGSAITYQTVGSFEPNPDGSRALDTANVMSRRSAEGGWRSKDITPPHTEVTPVRFGGEYKVFSDDLNKAVLEAQDGRPLSPEASERTPYLRENTEPATYRPLVTGKEGFANVPPGTVFGGNGGGVGRSLIRVRAANSSLTHIVIDSLPPLLPGAPPPAVNDGSVYEWGEGQLHPVSVLPASEGGGMVLGDAGSGLSSVRNAVSEDGSRVFWSPIQNPKDGSNSLYLRDTETEETTRLDVAQLGADGTGLALPTFQGASVDGTVVFFTDSQRLTADASPSGRDLYRCEIPAEQSALGCATLTDLSAPIGGSGQAANVKELVPAFSEDGSSVYFVATGVLDTTPNGAGETPLLDAPNLYVWQKGEGVRFVARLSPSDRGDWAEVPGVPNAAKIAAASSPDGRYLTFMSERSLTGYDNRDAISGELDEEVFRYDAAAAHLDCISCNPSGALPAGELSNPTNDHSIWVDSQSLWVKHWVAATLPEASESEPTVGLTFFHPRAVQDSGRVFFNAIDALVPADSNGRWDVYQYEPIGVGDCTASSGGAGIARSAGGCVSLVSSGTSEEEAAFLDASEGGNDAFFVTKAQLSVLDEDHEYDVYDARVDGVPAVLAPSTECLGEACQPAAVAPNDATPASASFKGEGNAKQGARKRCARGKRQVKQGGKSRCVTRNQKHKRKRAAKSGRASR